MQVLREKGPVDGVLWQVFWLVRTTAEQNNRQQTGSTANERFKAQWDSRLAWSTVLAVVAHAAILLLGPSWTAAIIADDSEPVELQRLVGLDDVNEAPGLGESPLAPIVTDDEYDDAGEQADLQDHEATVDTDAAALWEALGDRLRRRSDVVPTLAEPNAEVVPSDAEEVGEGEHDELSIEGRASTAELPELPEADALDLDRLADLRPELAFVTPSAWVLIRNPTEVETFLRRGYREGGLDPELSGSVNVTIWIDQRGSVEWAEVSKSSGTRVLDEIALAVFNEVAAFRPAREEGVSVSRSVTFSVNFPWVAP